MVSLTAVDFLLSLDILIEPDPGQYIDMDSLHHKPSVLDSMTQMVIIDDFEY